jgi:predicted nucleic acid-binding protein
MNVMDSSWWIEYFLNTIDDATALIIEDFSKLYVPAIVLYEVFKKLLVETNEEIAATAIVQMRKGIVVDLDGSLAIYAAYISREYKLPMADSIIYATTLRYNATLWTQDKHFDGLSQVQYSSKSA